MGMRKLSTAFLVILGGLALVPFAAAQQCTNPPCPNNPVPCAHCIGTWTDDGWPIVYEVSSEPNPGTPGEYSVSGTATNSNVPGGCTFTYDISGTINQNPSGKPLGTTELHWTMADRNESCDNNGDPWYSLSFTFDGTMTNNSCDTASGTWANTEGPEPRGTGNLTMNKPADRPTSPYETSTWIELLVTLFKFRGTLQGPNSFAGRQVFEVANPAYTNPPTSPNFDNCYRSGDPQENGGPYGLSGGGWFVGLTGFSEEHGNQYSADGIGWENENDAQIYSKVIDYYRVNGRAPCAAEAGQDMKIYPYSGAGDDPYKHNVLRYEIGLTTVKATRDYGQPTGASREINWGITTTYLLEATKGLPYASPLEGNLYPLSPITWTIESGSLPAGLALESLTSNTGRIYGVPSVTGTYPLIVRANASGQYSSKYFVLTVTPPRSLFTQVTSQ